MEAIRLCDIQMILTIFAQIITKLILVMKLSNFSTHLLVWLCLVLVHAGAWTQARSSASIVGTIIDAKTREAIPYAQVVVVGTTLGTASDASGGYRISGLPPGTYTLEASILGYATASERVTITGTNTRHLDFYLTEQSIEIDDVVVSANRQTTLRKMAPSLVTVLSRDVFVKTHSENLSQGLRFQPGLRVEDNCQNCGFNQVRINGLEGAYSQILIDSRPVFSALAAVYGLEQIPASMIERVEVVRGGGSALFGSNAVGGVINVITREPLSSSASLTHSYTAYGRDAGSLSALQPTTSFNGALVTEDRRAAFMAFGQHSARAGHDYNGDAFTELPELKNRALGFRAYYKPGLYSKLTAEYRSMHEYRRGGDQLDQPPFAARIAEYLQHYINGGSLRYDLGSASGRYSLSLYASAQDVLRKSYYGGGDTADKLLDRIRSNPNDQGIYDEVLASLTGYGRSRGFDAQAGGVYVYKLPSKIDFTIGLEGAYSKLNDKSGFRPAHIDQVVRTISQFDQIEYKGERWNLLLGGRFDYVYLTQNGVKSIDPLLIISPRANIRFNPIKDLSLRLSYSEGFRAPQFFDEEMHVELAGGEPVARVLGEGLREERSRSLSASIDWYGSLGEGWQYNLMVEGFATFLRNQFVVSPVEKTINGIRQRIITNNTDGVARVYGANIEGKIGYRRLWELQAGLTLQRSLYASPKEVIAANTDTGQPAVYARDYERTPRLYGYFTTTLRPLKRMTLNLSGTYTGSMDVPHEAYEGDLPNGLQIDSRGHFDTVVDGQRLRGVAPGHGYMFRSRPFMDLDCKVSYEIPLASTIELDISLGAQNIFDAYQSDADMGPGRASTYVYGPMLPRRIYSSVTLHF